MHECRRTRASTGTVAAGCSSNCHKPSACSHVYCVNAWGVCAILRDSGSRGVPTLNTLPFLSGNPIFFFFEFSSVNNPRSTSARGLSVRAFFSAWKTSSWVQEQKAATMSRRRVVVKQQKPQGGGMQAAMKEVRVFFWYFLR